MTSEYNYSGRTSSESVASASNDPAEFRARATADLVSLVGAPRAKSKAHKPVNKNRLLSTVSESIVGSAASSFKPNTPENPIYMCY